MQFQRDRFKISKLFCSVQPQDHLVIVLKRPDTKTDSDSQYTNCSVSKNFCNENEVLHIIVSNVGDRIFEYKLNGQLIGNTTFKYTTDTGKWNQTFSIVVNHIEETNRWELRFNIRTDFANFVREEHTNAIHDIVNFSGETALPALCAAACAKRADRVERATFSAVLARRIGNTLANDLTRMMFPEVDECATGHSLLNKLLIK